MGIVYTGPYEDYLHPPGVRHEGYIDDVLPDGSLHTGPAPTAPIGVCATCECGWRSTTIRTVAEHGEGADQAAEDDYRDEHLNPLLTRAAAEFWPTWQQHTTSMIDLAAQYMAQGRTRAVIACLVDIKRRVDDGLVVANHVADQANAAQHPPPISPAAAAFGQPAHPTPTRGQAPLSEPAPPRPDGRATTR